MGEIKPARRGPTAAPSGQKSQLRKYTRLNLPCITNQFTVNYGRIQLVSFLLLATKCNNQQVKQQQKKCLFLKNKTKKIPKQTQDTQSHLKEDIWSIPIDPVPSIIAVTVDRALAFPLRHSWVPCAEKDKIKSMRLKLKPITLLISNRGNTSKRQTIHFLCTSVVFLLYHNNLLFFFLQ